MKTCLPLILSLLFASQAFAGQPDTITNAPSGEYSIIQHDVSTSECGACFDTVLHFHDKSKPDVNLTLTEGEFSDFAYRAFARYFISPDDRWILRIQHLGGGTNEAFLYSVAPNGRVRRREISNPVFDRIGDSLHRSINGRTQIELASWDIPSGSVHLEASYEPLKNGVQQPWLNFNVTYNLKNTKVVVTKEVDEN
jgi:hypothetical protein